MAGVDQLQADLKELERQIIAALPEIAVKVTVNAKAIIQENIKNIGFGAAYSNTQLPIWVFHKKELNNAGVAFLKNKKEQAKATGEPATTNWGEFRAAQGLPNDHVNLSYTNKMFAGLGPLNPYWEGTVIRCPLGGNSQEVIDKFNWQRDRYGDFVSKVLRQQEMDTLAKVAISQIGAILKRNNF